MNTTQDTTTTPAANSPTSYPSNNKMNPDTQNPRNVINKPARMSNLKDFQQENQPKNPGAFVVSARPLAINNTAIIRATPLEVSNGLPATYFWLGDRNETTVTCRFHLGSCASLNTGNLFFHQWLMKKYPENVHRYDQLDDSNPFEPIMLEGELNVE